MFESKYSKVLTVILVIVIIAIIGLLGFLGFDYYKKVTSSKDAANFVNDYQDEENEKTEQNEKEEVVNNPFEQLKDNQSQQSTGKGKKQYKGFTTIGTIEIPKTNVKYPILEKLTRSSLETSVVFLTGTGINQPGNSVIIGHNYRNGMFFSNNKKLKNGDKIYITDENGKKLTYTIYKKFEASADDTSFYQRDTAGKPEITLSTCTDNSKARLIIFAKVD